jgi:predicted transcriptional regulator
MGCKILLPRDFHHLSIAHTIIYKKLLFIILMKEIEKWRYKKDPHGRMKAVCDYINKNPGVPCKKLPNALGFSSTSTHRILKLLRKKKRVKLKVVGARHYYYPPGTRSSKMRPTPAELQGEIYMIIKKFPGVCVNEIAMNLDATKQAVSYHIRLLKHYGFITTCTEGRYVHCYPL